MLALIVLLVIATSIVILAFLHYNRIRTSLEVNNSVSTVLTDINNLLTTATQSTNPVVALEHVVDARAQLKSLVASRGVDAINEAYGRDVTELQGTIDDHLRRVRKSIHGGSVDEPEDDDEADEDY